MRLRTTLTLLLACVSGGAFATTFVIPTDEELIARSSSIVIGTVEGSYVVEAENTIETIYEIRVERGMKGSFQREELLRVTTFGGTIGDRGLFVPAEAKFTQGERVLLFLTADSGRWRATDMTLGKFRFAVSTTGERLLVRNMEDVFGWDRSGKVPEEKIRKEEGFLRFIDARVRGQAMVPDYAVSARDVMIESADERFMIETNASGFPPETYTSWVSGQPTRWPNVSAGVNFYKRSDQNIAGAADGGVGAIQSGLGAWNNECGSVINLVYAGQRATASANHDGVNVVEYNDPQGRISGSWTGSGTVGIAFLSFAGSHSFAGRTWWNITDADVVFQNGYTASHGGFATAMTHELGHGIGWRHSNQHYDGGGACNPSVEECTTAAIMNSSVVANYGYSLQPWDVNAAQAVYPGGSCGTPPPSCTPPSITSQPQSATIVAGASITLTVGASGTAPLAYQWYVGTSGNTAQPVPGATGPSLTVSPSNTTSYWARVSNSCGAASSATVTITTTSSHPGEAFYTVNPCRVTDSRNTSAILSGDVRNVRVIGVCGIPTDALAVSFNVTAVAPTAAGFLVLYPGPSSAGRPATSTINFRVGQTRANNAIIRLGSDGTINVYNGTGAALNFLVDVNGFFR